MLGAMSVDPELARLIRALPKAELHLHIEGTLEPEMVFELAERNGVDPGYPSVDALRAAYQFSDLQSFLDVYYAGANVLLKERDFRDMTRAYLDRAAADKIVHAEIFFDPQTHTARGVPLEAVIGGIRRGLEDGARAHGISSELILCFLRHLSEEEALETFEQAQPFLSEIIGVGLDSGEAGNPPEKFERVFAKAREAGLRVVAHAGEEGPAAYIQGALDVLGAERIDHGVRCTEDDALVERLAREQIPLTVCPLSNVALRVFPNLADHNLPELLRRGLLVSIHSDDPAYFGGYLGKNFEAVAEALPVSADDLVTLAANSLRSSFLPDDKKREYLQAVERAAAQA
jgi:adenine deaminase